jgi:iron complex transport system ATP-binding protein
MSDRAVFEVTGLEFAYGSLRVLDGLDLTVEPGFCYGIVGPNGCGKTTLVDLLIRTRQPAAGEIRFMGRDLEGYRRSELARKVALVPQEFGINFPFSVAETVLMGRHPYIARFSSPRAEDREAVERALAEMDLLHLRDKPVTDLSGGEKQRVVLARSLAQETPVLLLDEPTSNLDIRHSLAILGRVRRRVAEEGRTVVAVMHDLNLAAAHCDRLVFLRGGRVYAAGATMDVLNEETIREVFAVDARVGYDDYAGCRLVTYRRPSA